MESEPLRVKPAGRQPWNRTVFALLLFGAAFGYLEAAVVSYLRILHEPARLRYYPNRAPGDLFPLLTLEQLRASGPVQTQTLPIEIGREAATIVMLAAIALAVAGNTGQWAAAFVIAFGAWDVTFYLFLKLVLGWPASLFTWDILFLIPVPWAGPVVAPVLVSVAMIVAGVWQLRSEARGEPVRIGAADALGAIGPAASAAVPALAARLADKSEGRFVFRSSLQSLGMIGSGAKAALPQLEEIVRQTGPNSVAAQTIRLIEGKDVATYY